MAGAHVLPHVLDSEAATDRDSYQCNCVVQHKLLSHSDSESASRVIVSVDVRVCMHVRNTFV